MVGLVSISFSDAMLEVIRSVLRISVLSIILYASFFIHAALGIYSLVSKRSFRMRKTDWIQLVTGILIPWFLIGHAYVGGMPQDFLALTIVMN